MENLTESQDYVFDIINSEAISIVRNNAVGIEFVRVNLYVDALNELLENGETEKEIVGAHFFTSEHSDDIDKSNQIEIHSFMQDEMKWVEGGGSWEDTERGENFLNEAEYAIVNAIISAISAFSTK